MYEFISYILFLRSLKLLISIIVPFYDNDYDKIPNIINEMNKLTFNKEIIFVDDRNDKTEDVRNKYIIPNEYKIIRSHETFENVGTFEARRSGVLNATGDYIWFIDIDDEPLNFDTSILNNKKELYMFNNYVYSVQTNTCKKSLYVNRIFQSFIINNFYDIMNTDGNIFNININHDNLYFVGNVLKNMLIPVTFSVWDKLFKTSILKECLSNIKTLKNFKLYEDAFLIRLYLKTSIENYKNINIQYLSSSNYKYYEYQDEKYEYKNLFSNFSKETINYSLSLFDKFFKGTWIELLTPDEWDDIKHSISQTKDINN
jgi:hypothetical protein